MAKAQAAPKGPVVLSAKTHMLLNDAWEDMRRHRKEDRAGRVIRRGWKYGEGKQIALKAGVGVAVGVVFTGVSVATAGAALPIVLAVAAGGYAAGQAANGAFAVLKNRGVMRGLGATANWVDSVRSLSMQEQQDNLRALDTRAYKTIRRAYEHFREASRKSVKAEEARVKIKKGEIRWTPCDDYLELLSASLSVSHHLHKARLYLEPCIHVERVLLYALHAWIREWRDAESKLGELIDEFMNQHKEPCDKNCYLGSTGSKKGAPDRPDAVVLCADNRIEWYDKAMADLFGELAVASVAPRPNRDIPPADLPRVRKMMNDTYDYWSTRRKSPDVRIAHFIRNTWDRKTKTERAALVTTQVVTAGMGALSTAGGQAADAPMKVLVDQGMKGLDVGLAFGATAADSLRDFFGGMGIDKFAEKVAPTPDVTDDTDLKHHAGSTAAATENRDFLRKAAQHLYEADERKKQVDALGSLTITSCGQARELAAHVFAVNHHIGKAQQYLERAMELTHIVGTQVRDASRKWNKGFESVYRDCSKRVAYPEHDVCSPANGGRACYGPVKGNPAQPILPITAGW